MPSRADVMNAMRCRKGPAQRSRICPPKHAVGWQQGRAVAEGSLLQDEDMCWRKSTTRLRWNPQSIPAPVAGSYALPCGGGADRQGVCRATIWDADSYAVSWGTVQPCSRRRLFGADRTCGPRVTRPGAKHSNGERAFGSGRRTECGQCLGYPDRQEASLVGVMASPLRTLTRRSGPVVSYRSLLQVPYSFKKLRWHSRILRRVFSWAWVLFGVRTSEQPKRIVISFVLRAGMAAAGHRVHWPPAAGDGQRDSATQRPVASLDCFVALRRARGSATPPGTRLDLWAASPKHRILQIPGRSSRRNLRMKTHLLGSPAPPALSHRLCEPGNEVPPAGRFEFRPLRTKAYIALVR